MNMEKFSFGLSPVLFITVTVLFFVVATEALVPASLQRNFLKAQLRQACLKKDESEIFEIVYKLQGLNPTTDIMQDFKMLGGDWKLDFTTAPEREVPRESENDDAAKTYQTVDTERGVIYNIIDRGLPEKGLRIAVGAEATRTNRVALDFRTIEAYNDRFPKKVVLNFPPRSFFRTVFKFQKLVKGEPYDETEFKEIGHFDLLFLDEDLRIQQNSEGNIFINSKM
uniref:Plastid lipid-associated protein/fibrillin conserved domain-containing protein n=1 Tax=Corethron hystrix TaxID=216773 RepID=A0A7S1C2D1_9STRA|mmetsp:Transcript_9500/g.21077  ORF Transcript_9500/g.21077 Transcript_9500/m.21077 type:complete len:225 (+) Transcript_9500:73-747(+)|eukprot:CAMPEP_0113300264 /NCGR_PEP_ID=MMETSP0010_2-20120614/1968_1 /TAXON_ID=216773 ORGANISM="Corethron hystrix, Strain 308" /NCGR_SAMPLE_ID=MMETSP0010_2 /ASSEMBLY_ACC=CAM_ASM_000155 /LENGTH=224 /DNA_ID=CAMNT_0000153663 /DNA_START=44 /DNA_END=718 /DNA_ORIENTATION=- /assembly_acc=CAM_ASM_000155